MGSCMSLQRPGNLSGGVETCQEPVNMDTLLCLIIVLSSDSIKFSVVCQRKFQKRLIVIVVRTIDIFIGNFFSSQIVEQNDRKIDIQHQFFYQSRLLQGTPVFTLRSYNHSINSQYLCNFTYGQVKHFYVILKIQMT